ncbi:MAG: hypothetical protein LBQ40_04475 [Clostridiales bacterium]|jgi:hypothetical protein|nr:hypothetical protein [Clostridiales bacterium]
MATVFNLTERDRAERKLLVTAVNVAPFGAAYSTTPIWEVIGADIEDSSVELNPDIITTTDILGETSTFVNKLQPKQSFTPNVIRGNYKLAERLHDIIARNALTEFSKFEVLLIRVYIGASGAYQAEKQTDCTIVPTSIGGSATLDMPIEISFSNNKTLGTVNAYKRFDTIVFTPETTEA